MERLDPHRMSILLIGTLPPPIGGTSVSFQHLTDSLRARKDIDVRIVNTSGIRGRNLWTAARNFGLTLQSIFKESRRSDIITLHVGLHALPLLAPIVWACSRMQRKPYIIRRFGGNDHRELKGPLFRVVDPILRRADLYLLQTRVQLQAVVESGFKNVAWFPTARPPSKAHSPPVRDESCRRFVFLSQVKPNKGIPEILLSAENLPEDFIVHIYGPLFDGLTVESFSGHPRIRYLGQVAPDKILEILRSYHALLLPTYYPGEGYPGIILEAFSLGMPVITTRWKSIPEIVDDECGILIPPRDAKALEESITSLGRNGELYRKLSYGAFQRHRLFDLEVWVETFISFCRDAVENQGKSDVQWEKTS